MQLPDRRGHVVEDIGSITAARDGKDLVLALDSRIQSLAYSELKAALTQHRAKSGAIVVAKNDAAHEALAKQSEEHAVVSVERSGYKLNGSIIRPAQVII